MFAVVGPGRLGQALARRLREGGETFHGFLGRDASRTLEAIDFVGDGAVLLGPADLLAADCIVLAVQDDELAQVAADLAAQLGDQASGRLWLHTRGCHDLALLQPFAARHHADHAAI